MTDKLYPPIIAGTLPAFYTITENGSVIAKITVPFSMNKAVSSKNIHGFALKIKTAYSNTYINVLENNNFNPSSKEVVFIWKKNDIDKFNIKPGQFLKVQLAYIGENNTIGYYSTVGVIKYTDKPTLTISEFEFENNSGEDDLDKIRTFCSTCTGIYTPGENDISEKPYQYQFLLYDDNDQIIEDSGWLLYNNEEDMGNFYTFKSKMDTLTIYQVQYNIKTINNLEVSSKKYKCLIPEEEINNPLILKAENIYEEGYINLSFFKKSNSSLNENDIPYIIDIYREESGTDNQCFIHRVKIEDDNDLNWSFQDFTIEQGITYLYYFKYNKNGYHSQIYGDENENPVEVVSDFEDMFLYDGQKQIKLRFNPKVSSFKINHLEQKTDVIGNRYPVFFRNSIVEYKEFPISGLISYHLDDNELFIQDSLQELGIQRNILERLGTNHDYDENSPFSTEQGKYFNSQSSSVKSLNLISNNIKAERLFKMKLLDWLGNGEIKLFKSPSEGNYLVRLMNISLSPEDKLNRMLHTFSCTAYEAKEFNFENLEKLGFINIDQSIQVETINKNIYYLKENYSFYPAKINPSLSKNSLYGQNLKFINNNGKEEKQIIKSDIYLYRKNMEENNNNNNNEKYKYIYCIKNDNNEYIKYYIYDKNGNSIEITDLTTYPLNNDNNNNYEKNSCSIYTSFIKSFTPEEISPSEYFKLEAGAEEQNNKFNSTNKQFRLINNEEKKILKIKDVKKYLANWIYTTLNNGNTYTQSNYFYLGPCVYLEGSYIIKVDNSSQGQGD